MIELNFFIQYFPNNIKHIGLHNFINPINVQCCTPFIFPLKIEFEINRVILRRDGWQEKSL